MQKVSTAVIIGIVCVLGLGFLIYLNRDKIGSKKEVAAAAPAQE